MKIKILPVLISAFLIFFVITGCTSSQVPNKVYGPEDLEGKTVGVLSGSESEAYVEYSGQNVYIRTCRDSDTLASELLSGEVDAVVADEKTTEQILKSSSKLRKLDTPLGDDNYCIAVSQENNTLLDNVNSAIEELKSNGTLEELEKAWFGGEYTYEFSYTEGDDFTQTLTVAIPEEYAPYSFYSEDKVIVGYEADLARLICQQLGVNVSFQVVSLDRILYMVESGKVNFSIGRITKGDGAVLYSESYLTSVQNIIVRKG